MKYYISWEEKNFPKKPFVCRSLIQAFQEVYGVRTFVIYNKRITILGSHFNVIDNYDLFFHYLIDCFLTKRQQIKLYKKLCKSNKKLFVNKYQLRESVKNQLVLEDLKRSDFSFSDYLKENLNAKS